MRKLLVVIQHELFNLGGELSIPGFTLLNDAAVARLDAALAHHNVQLLRLAEFILPAGTCSAALAHVSRTIARRAERAVVHLALQEPVNAAPQQYLNRLSDPIGQGATRAPVGRRRPAPLQQELAIGHELEHLMVLPAVAGNPHLVLRVHVDAVLAFRKISTGAGQAPRPQHRALSVKLDDGRRRHAARGALSGAAFRHRSSCLAAG